MSDLIAELEEFEKAALEAISSAADERVLEAARVGYLGARHGRLKEMQALLGKAGKDQKPVLGKKFNDVKTLVTAALDDRKRALARPVVTAGGLDVTLPGIVPELGRRHPLSQTILEFKEIMG